MQNKPYRPTLTVNTKNIAEDSQDPEVQATFEDAKKYSITPTTLESMQFDNNVEDSTYIERYKSQKNDKHTVELFALNPRSSALQTEVTQYNSNKQKAPPVSLASIISQKDAAQKQQSIVSQKADANKSLTAIEVVNTLNAINYLIANPAVKTVLIDIFERGNSKDKKNNDINYREDDQGNITTEPKTHTVVLYAQNGKYLVIDPNNATFSQILIGAHDDIRVCASNKFKIYQSPTKDTGPKPEQGRDCTDLAVKLAFSLSFINKDTITITEIPGANTGYITSESLESNYAIKLLSNNSEKLKMFDTLDNTPFRVKQSSDLKHAQKTHIFLKNLKTMKDNADSTVEQLDLKYSSLKLDEFNDRITELIKKAFKPNEYDQYLQEFQTLTNDFHDLTGMGQMKLFGAEIMLIDSA